jgi:hypothetical protein
LRGIRTLALWWIELVAWIIVLFGRCYGFFVQMAMWNKNELFIVIVGILSKLLGNMAVHGKLAMTASLKISYKMKVCDNCKA